MKTVQTIIDEVAQTVHCDKGGVCGYFARLATIALKDAGITDFTIIFGYVQLEGLGGKWRDEHIWIESNGIKYDPTVIQFEPEFRGYAKSKRIRSYTPDEFLALPNFQITDDWGPQFNKIVQYSL